jgi:hypothetical protein
LSCFGDFVVVLTFWLRLVRGVLQVRKKFSTIYLGRVPSYFFRKKTLLYVEKYGCPGKKYTSPGDQAPMYDLIIGKQTMHDLGVKFYFQERTIIIDKILLPMRNIANLKLKPRISRALTENTCFAQEPISTRNATKPVVEILDAKYEKADLPAIIRENCSHLTAPNR